METRSQAQSRRAPAFLAVAAISFLLPVVLLPETNEDPPADEGYLRLDVTVRDAAGEPVSGLSAGNFTLLDNGRATSLVSFHAWDGPLDGSLEAILVIDTVNLPSEQLRIAQREAVRFLRASGGRLALPVMIYRLSGEGLTRSEHPALDGNQLAREVEHGAGPVSVWQGQLRPIQADLPTDYASRRNAFSVSALGSIVLEARRRPGRKLLFWLGPGWQVKSGGEYTFDEVVELSTRMREARLEISTLTPYAYPEDEFTYPNLVAGLRSPKDGSPFDMMLEVLAIQSGGRALPPTFDLAGELERALRVAAPFYSLTFDPPRAATVDEYHALKVEVNRPGLSVSTRSGYYDEPVIYDQPPERTQVTVAGLTTMLVSAEGEGDQELATRLDGVELSERLPETAAQSLTARMPGSRSRNALVVVAGASAFRGPPPGVVLDRPAPEVAAQKEMIARTVSYLGSMIPRLPNFYATRTTAHYEERRPADAQAWKAAGPDTALHLGQTTRSTILIRDGKEVVNVERKRGIGGRRTGGLVTEGTFWPILAAALAGASAPQSRMEWTRWEQGAVGPEAVFRLNVPATTPLFDVTFCCEADPDGSVEYNRRFGFHGEIAIDPENGAVLRIVLLADLEPRLPVVHSGIAVDYGPVSIGGKTYICPRHSVTLSRSRTVRLLHEWHGDFGVYGPFETKLNDAVFSDFHLFRSSARILPGAEVAQ